MPEDGPWVVETARLRLRRLREADADWLWALDQDPEVMRYLSGGQPTRPEVFPQVLERMLQDFEKTRELGFYAAERRDDGEVIGWFHLRPETLEPYAMDLGYRLRRECWGHGFATEGSQGLITLAFERWGQKRVVAHALAENRASWRVMERCGMWWERSFYCPEAWFPGWPRERLRAVRYVVEREDWAAKGRER